MHLAVPKQKKHTTTKRNLTHTYAHCFQGYRLTIARNFGYLCSFHFEPHFECVHSYPSTFQPKQSTYRSEIVNEDGAPIYTVLFRGLGSGGISIRVGGEKKG